MRKPIKQFVKICTETLSIYEPIYEFGALQVPGQEGFANLRPYFHGKKYIGTDMRKGPGVDIILDLHKINLQDESAGTVLILETLEHVEFARKAVEEAYRILKPNGVLIISSCMNFPIHDYPSDYWRFTPEAFKSFLKPFNFSFVGSAGEKNFPHTVVGVGVKGPVPEETINKLAEKTKQWEEQQMDFFGSGLVGVVKSLTPPILLPILVKIYIKIHGIFLTNKK